MSNKKRIAIIGSGISGLSMAYFLKDEFEINLYEKDNRLGGHSRTISINTETNKLLTASSKVIIPEEIQVDTGFIVLNDRTYPNLIKLFENLGIELSKTEMTFAISANNGELEWSGTSIDSMFSMRKNIFNPHMLRGIFDILKFNKNAVKFAQKFPQITLGDLIDKMNLKSWFKDYYILPMGGAIWSCSAEKMMDFPASTFVNFFDNHGLLTINNRPQWYTLKDKSISYVSVLKKLIEEKHQIITHAKIESIKRTEIGVEIKESEKQAAYYDEVIFAAHPAEILSVLKDVTKEEKSILEKFSRQKNTAYTHGDSAQMPKLKKCWSSWNYLYLRDSKESSVSVTYWMNKLQHLNEDFQIFVTLNPVNPIPKDKIYDINDFYHPVFDKSSIEGQNAIDNIQGKNKLWFCGAYLRYGFHEDGIWSTLNVLSKINRYK